jgi:hypothetical protein
MILQFAHFLRDAYLKKGYKDVEVYTHIPSGSTGVLLDLCRSESRSAKVAWHPLKNMDWLMPFDDR